MPAYIDPIDGMVHGEGDPFGPLPTSPVKPVPVNRVVVERNYVPMIQPVVVRSFDIPTWAIASRLGLLAVLAFGGRR